MWYRRYLQPNYVEESQYGTAYFQVFLSIAMQHIFQRLNYDSVYLSAPVLWHGLPPGVCSAAQLTFRRRYCGTAYLQVYALRRSFL